MTIPKAIKPLGALDKYIHCMIVAGPGFGKTVFWGTAPNALFLTTDPEGTVSAWAFGSAAQEWEVKTWTALNDAYKYLRDGGIAEMNLDWVIIDNASEAQNLGMRENIDNSRKHNASLDEFIPSQANYQRTQNMMLDLVKKFHDLPVNVGWTAWTETHEDNEGNEYFAPGIHGQKGMIAQTIAGYMNMVGYGEVVEINDKEVRRIWFTQRGPFRGKDRFTAMGAKRDALDVPKMMQLIEAKKAELRKARSAGKTASTTKKVAPVRRTATTRKVSA